MKRFLRWTLRLCVTLAVLLVIGILSCDTVARILITRQIHRQTGLETKIGRVRIGWLHPEITIENLVLYNPAEFGGSPFIDLPELHVEYDRGALFAHQLHCKLVRFNLARLNLVEDKQGRHNFDFLQAKSSTRDGGGKAPRKNPPSAPVSGAMEFTGIDRLNLTLGKATYTHMGQSNQMDELNLNMNHQNFPEIKSEQDLYALLLIVYLKSNPTTPGNGQNWLQLFSPPAK